MLIHNISQVENKSLHDAILIARLQGFSLESVYIDPNQECAIRFKGQMPESVIQEFFFNINPNVNCDSRIEDEELEYNVDFTYYPSFTEIYTREGWKF